MTKSPHKQPVKQPRKILLTAVSASPQQTLRRSPQKHQEKEGNDDHPSTPPIVPTTSVRQSPWKHVLLAANYVAHHPLSRTPSTKDDESYDTEEAEEDEEQEEEEEIMAIETNGSSET